MNSTERHAVLLDPGWTTRVDGLMWPPPDWPDQRPHTAKAAWRAHATRVCRGS